MRAQNIAGTGGKTRKDKERIRKQIKARKDQGEVQGRLRKEEDGPQFSTGGLIHVDIESVY